MYEKFRKAFKISVPLVSVNTADPALFVTMAAACLPEETTVYTDEKYKTGVLCWDTVRGLYIPVGALKDLAASKTSLQAIEGKSGSKGSDLVHPHVVLQYADYMRPGCVMFMHNLNRFFGQSEVLQGLSNLRDIFKMDRRMIVMAATANTIPPMLRHDVLELDEPLPTLEEVEAHLRTVLDGDEREEIVQAAKACQGFSLFGAEQVLLLNTNVDRVIDVEGVWADKCAKINQVPGLKVASGRPYSSIAGVSQIKKFVGQLMTGNRKPNVVVWVDEFEKALGGASTDTSGVTQDQVAQLLHWMESTKAGGCILAGDPGTAKSAFAQATGCEFGVPTIRLDLGAMKGSLIGESMRGDQEFYWYTKQRGGLSHRVTFAEFYEQYDPAKTYWVDSVNDHGGNQRRRLTNVFRHNREQDYYRVKTKTGKIVVVTEGHELFVKKKGVGGIGLKEKRVVSSIVPKRLCDLSVGDRIAVAWRITREESRCGSILDLGGFVTDITEDEACLMGLWVADGSWNGRRLRISVDAREKEMINFITSFGPCTMTYKGENGLDITINADRVSSLAYMFCRGHSRSKRIPAFIYGMHERLRCAWLRGMFSGDGWREGNAVVYGTCAKKLASDVSELLRSVGIHNVVAYDSRKGNRVNVLKRRAASLFKKKVGCIQPHKDARCDGHQCAFHKGRTINSVMFDPIVQIDRLDSDEPFSYDIEVEGTNRFLVDGIVCHNSESRIREALAVLGAVSAGKTLWLATVNSIDRIPPELRRRFRYGTWYFGLPDRTEREAIWSMYCGKWDLDASEAVDLFSREWTGAEIETCCDLANQTGQSLMDCAEFIAPISQDPKGRAAMEALQAVADGAFLSASRPGVYTRAATHRPPSGGKPGSRSVRL
jgi:intein/homing endonuclease